MTAIYELFRNQQRFQGPQFLSCAWQASFNHQQISLLTLSLQIRCWLPQGAKILLIGDLTTSLYLQPVTDREHLLLVSPILTCLFCLVFESSLGPWIDGRTSYFAAPSPYLAILQTKALSCLPAATSHPFVVVVSPFLQDSLPVNLLKLDWSKLCCFSHSPTLPVWDLKWKVTINLQI